jgi:hypothetical protein
MTNRAAADSAALVERACAWWPQYPWHRAQFHHGAFHDVLVIPGQVVARLGRSAGAAARIAGEHHILALISAGQARWSTPRSLSAVRTTREGHAGMLTSWIPGRHHVDASWPRVAAELTTLLRSVQAGEAFRADGALAEPRGWCGSDQFPHIVTELLLPLLPADARPAARQAVTDMLAAERAVAPVPVHGDLGMHNILWHDVGDGRPADLAISGLIDFDNAALGDPAIDVAPLLGQFGSAALAGAITPGILDRAKLHRATLSLQVAAAAELRHDSALRDFALASFARRFATGTLYDPYGGN